MENTQIGWRCKNYLFRMFQFMGTVGVHREERQNARTSFKLQHLSHPDSPVHRELESDLVISSSSSWFLLLKVFIASQPLTHNFLPELLTRPSPRIQANLLRVRCNAWSKPRQLIQNMATSKSYTKKHFGCLLKREFLKCYTLCWELIDYVPRASNTYYPRCLLVCNKPPQNMGV